MRGNIILGSSINSYYSHICMLIVFIILDIGVCCKSTERNLTVLSMPVGTSAQMGHCQRRVGLHVDSFVLAQLPHREKDQIMHESYSSDTTVERSGDIL